MKTIKKYGLVIGIILPLIVMIIIRLSGQNHFKPDAGRWAEPSLQKTNIVTSEQLEEIPGDKLIISDANIDKLPVKFQGNTELISVATVLSKASLKTLRNHKGPVLVYTGEPAVSARIWMLVSQLGYNNIYILTSETENELLKNKNGPTK